MTEHIVWGERVNEGRHGARDRAREKLKLFIKLIFPKK